MRIVIASLMSLSLISSPALAGDPCVAYYGKGYCTDYVNARISNPQEGNAENWIGGLPRNLVRRGDVAIFRRVGHVAYIEDVTARDSAGNPTRIRISEWNWAPGFKPGTPKSCRITKNFGVKTIREIDVSQVDDFYGPTYKSNKLPLPTKPAETVNNILYYLSRNDFESVYDLLDWSDKDFANLSRSKRLEAIRSLGTGGIKEIFECWRRDKYKIAEEKYKQDGVIEIKPYCDGQPFDGRISFRKQGGVVRLLPL